MHAQIAEFSKSRVRVAVRDIPGPKLTVVVTTLPRRSFPEPVTQDCRSIFVFSISNAEDYRVLCVFVISLPIDPSPFENR